MSYVGEYVSISIADVLLLISGAFSMLHEGSRLVLPRLEPSFLLLWEINYIKLPKYLRS